VQRAAENGSSALNPGAKVAETRSCPFDGVVADRTPLAGNDESSA
jgi:hypothetical protein